MTFYDSTGRAVAYTEDNENIYLYSGDPVGYLYGNLVYSYKGTQLGRFENGWIRDKRGDCAFFTEAARGDGPTKPVKQVKPVKGLKKLMPIKGIRHVPFLKTVDSLSWSSLSDERFFLQ
ncbi:hypothetical protein SAMN02745671_02261 [Anaerovibrio lipolyticus DSM 3074]|uniref:4-fold beta flower domain-containing protein n=1 Tax=Anaerovibrio lipolyticus DSM 3074 TaxID=1120997 RepID=A0A1M6FFX8_9FIRM|nr:hypothetical protein [Anaerovibrio lipolyticus]SHI96546.1 hypothetical protein SAMN02745671_02261 [Anaerovibrio lipolyticus DSM 3074]